MSGPLDQMPPEVLTPEEALIAARKTRAVERLKKERLDWWQLREVYERCKAIAEQVWQDDLDKAQSEQQELAELMRDRIVATQRNKDVTWLPQFKGDVERKETVVEAGPDVAGEIPVPLFTPRDRLQFIKETTVALLIEAGKRGLTASPEPKEEAPLTASEQDAILPS